MSLLKDMEVGMKLRGRKEAEKEKKEGADNRREERTDSGANRTRLS